MSIALLPSHLRSGAGLTNMKIVAHLVHPPFNKIRREHCFSVLAISFARACGAKVVDGHVCKRCSTSTTYFRLRQDCYLDVPSLDNIPSLLF